jgi:hypothetical protein
MNELFEVHIAVPVQVKHSKESFSDDAWQLRVLQQMS